MVDAKRPSTPIAHTGFFAFRTPLRPYEELLGLSADLKAPRARHDAVALEQALTDDRRAIRERLRVIAERPEVREALFVASPSLEERLAHWLEAPDSERGQKVERALVRYVARMSGRPTPFGLFAGCSIGEIAEPSAAGSTAETRLRVSERSTYQRHTRLDMDYVCALTAALAADPNVREVLEYTPNTSLYRVAGRMRYAEGRLAAKVRSYHLVAVEETDYLAATLARADNGARPGVLAAALVEADPDITLEDAAAYVGELIDSQLLVADLPPTVTGPEPIHALVAQLSKLPPAAAVGETMRATRDALAAMDAAGLGAPPQRYRDIAAALEGLPARPELPRLFQVDMVKPAPHATLGQNVVDEITRAVDLFRKLSPGRPRDKLATFRQEFESRYEGREVPLVLALDEEMGIGFDKVSGPSADASPLLAGIAFPGDTEERGTPLSARAAFLLQKLAVAIRRGAHEIVLDDEDVKSLEDKEPAELPDSFSVMATIAAASEEAVASGDFRLRISGASGPSGARLLGRFCHADATLHERALAHLRREEALRPDAIFAEIAHLPEGRVGNILHRPLLREHEIPYLGRSGVTRDKQIPVSDLRVSVRGGRILLRSARLGKEVIPRLSNAHNFASNSLGIYRFLCALQGQEVAGGMGWSWGALDASPFLPRVRHGKLVLSLARWNVGKQPIKVLSEAKGGARYQAAQRLREELGLPRRIEVADGDNTLPIDLDNTLAIDTFVHLIKDRSEVRLEEPFPGEDALLARGPEGHFAHEIVVPFVRVREPSKDQGVAWRASVTQPLARSFATGSEWLYVKLFTGTSTADQVLGEVVEPVVAMAKQSGAIDDWFFLRHGDPEWHVRVRFHGVPARLVGEVLPALNEAAASLLADGRIWRVQLDTYEREVERYGGARGMELSERLFGADSDAVLVIVATLSGDEGSDARWRLALRGMDLLLCDLGMDLPTKKQIMKQIRDSFAEEFRANAALEKQLGSKFRKERPSLETLLDRANDAESWLAQGLAVLDARSARNAPICAALRAAEAKNQLSSPVRDLAASYLHMHANRILASAARAQELVLYDFLHHLYEGQIARAKQKDKPAKEKKSQVAG